MALPEQQRRFTEAYLRTGRAIVAAREAFQGDRGMLPRVAASMLASRQVRLTIAQAVAAMPYPAMLQWHRVVAEDRATPKEVRDASRRWLEDDASAEPPREPLPDAIPPDELADQVLRRRSPLVGQVP